MLLFTLLIYYLINDIFRQILGRAIFASGSPFPDVNIDGTTIASSQCNNRWVPKVAKRTYKVVFKYIFLKDRQTASELQ